MGEKNGDVKGSLTENCNLNKKSAKIWIFNETLKTSLNIQKQFDSWNSNIFSTLKFKNILTVSKIQKNKLNSKITAITTQKLAIPTQ